MKKNLISGIVIGVISIVLNVFGYLFAYYKNEWFSGNKTLSIVFFIIGSLLLLISFWFIHLYICEKKNKKKMNIRQLSIISSLAAITVILYYFLKFKLPFFPSFLDIQISEVPAIIAGFIYGPTSGILIILIRFFLKVPSSMTAGVGEMADLIIGIIIVLITALIYKKHRTLKGALMASMIGIIVSVLVACLCNYLILIPAYMHFMGLSYDTLAAMMAYIDGVNANNFMTYYIFLAVIPFNLLRFLLVFIVVFLLYKNMHRLFDLISE